MQIFIKTLTGKTICIEANPDRDTWLDIKNKIFEEVGIPIDQQRIVVAGNQVEDSQSVELYRHQEVGHCYLVLKLRPQITFDTHNVYAVVHNFYEDVSNAKLQSFQYVIPLEENMESDEIHEVFEKIYQARESRIEKNKDHVGYNVDPNTVVNAQQASSVIAIVGVKKSFQTDLYPGDWGTKTLVSLTEEPLPYELFCYVLPDGTPITSHSGTERKLNEINQAFRLFCAEKKPEDPNLESERREEGMKNYGEIKAYLDYTADTSFDGLSVEDRQTLLEGIKELSEGKQPNEDHQFYEDLKELDIVSKIEGFQIIKSKLENKVGDEREIILLEAKKVATLILKDKVEELEKKYCVDKKIEMGEPITINNNSEDNSDKNDESSDELIPDKKESDPKKEKRGLTLAQKINYSIGVAVSSVIGGLSGLTWGAGIGGLIGGFVGTFILPGLGTAAGAAIGASIGGNFGHLIGGVVGFFLGLGLMKIVDSVINLIFSKNSSGEQKDLQEEDQTPIKNPYSNPCLNGNSQEGHKPVDENEIIIHIIGNEESYIENDQHNEGQIVIRHGSGGGDPVITFNTFN